MVQPQTPRARGASPLTYSIRVPRVTAALPGPGEALLAAVLSSEGTRAAQPGQLCSVPCTPAWRSFMGLLPSRCPSRHRRSSRGRSVARPGRGTSLSLSRTRGLGSAAPLSERSRLASVLRSGCGRSQKNVSYYCLFLPGFSPPLPANKAFPIAEHTSTASLPSSRAPGPSSILVALPRPVPPAPVLQPSAFPPRFPGFQGKPKTWVGGCPSCLLPRASKGLWQKRGRSL